MISISLDDNESKWREAVKDDNVGWMQLVDLNGFENSKIREEYKVKAVPTVFLIDPAGEVVAINPTVDEVLNISAQR